MRAVKTGIYGGSFNPIHNGHIAIAKAMLALGAVDEVWLMVSPQNPLKQADDLLDDRLRLQMTRRAIEDIPGVEACDYEFGMPRPSYMWNTLQRLSADYTDREFTLLIGADNWQVFDRWYHADDIIAHYPICIYPRRGCHIAPTELPPTVRLIDTGLYDISSTEVRRRIRCHEDISQLIPPSIAGDAAYYYGQARQHDKPQEQRLPSTTSGKP